MQQTQNKGGKLIAVSVIILLVAALIYGIATYVSRRGAVPIEAYILPTYGKIIIDGEEKSSGTLYLTPGEHSVQVEAEGFTTEEQIITVTETNLPVIDIALVPESEEARQWQADNEELYFERKERGSERSQLEGEAFREKNPIVNDLPYDNLLYTIGYKSDPSVPSGDGIILTIDASDGYRTAALYQIQQLGYDASDYKIEFKNYENPFSS